VSPERVPVTVEGRELSLSNLDKHLYPSGFTKGELLDYYAKIAPVMLPHLQGRPVTVKRFPNGVGGQGFIEKNLPRHAPAWIATAVLPRKGRGSDTTRFPLVDGLAALTWFVNLAAIEFHTPMWRVNREGQPSQPDLVVFDLDPGAPATIVECCQVAQHLVEHLEPDGVELLAKTSGSKGLQLYGRIAERRWDGDRVNAWAHGVAEAVEHEVPELVVSRMSKSLRPGKVLIDWSQNNPAKTTVTAYSMRAVERPSVSTPVTGEEVRACAERGDPSMLVFSPEDVLQRVSSHGDLLAPLLASRRADGSPRKRRAAS
jgi:bifunctional non-homologous end joining protein LigD